MSDAFCIKPGYRANAEQRTFDAADADRYWNPARVEASGAFQYYVYAAARDLARARGYSSVLDVGCGPATKMRDLVAPVCSDVTLVDQPSTRDLAIRALPHAEFLPADLERIDLDLGRHFDLVICSDVLEHLLDPDACVRFVRRHLAPAGRAVFSTPERDALRGRDCMECPKAEHVREWSSAEFAAYLERNGFETVRRAWFPLKRIGRLEYAASRLLHRVAGRRRWAACQMAICRLAGASRDAS